MGGVDTPEFVPSGLATEQIATEQPETIAADLESTVQATIALAEVAAWWLGQAETLLEDAEDEDAAASALETLRWCAAGGCMADADLDPQLAQLYWQTILRVKAAGSDDFF